MKNLKKILETRKKLKENSPLIHAITHPIAINMAANAILAIGANPICAAHPDEVAEIVNISDSLSVNLGNITSERMVAIERACHTANEKGIPLAIDMVGVGASTLRFDFAKKILEDIHFDLIKGNASEIRALALGKSSAKGVDVGDADRLRGENIKNLAKEACDLAVKYDSIILVTGETDLIVGNDFYIEIKNGVSNLSRITGTGCMLTSLVSSFMAVANPVDAALLGLLIMEIAAEKVDTDRLYTFFVNLMDEIGLISNEEIIEKAKIREVKF